jgi:GNAT superfamily N-acetyltransferase
VTRDPLADRAEIDAVVATFFAAFGSGRDLDARLDALREVFLPQAVVVRTCGDEPLPYGVEGFLAPRRALLLGGGVQEFREWEVEGRTDLYGDIAQRWCTYAKAWRQDGARRSGSGVKTIQLVRTASGWRISAVAWDDAREGLPQPEQVAIRRARAGDLAALQRIERLAGEPFRALGMDAIADDAPPSVEYLARYQHAGRAWVAEQDNEPVGYLLLDVVADAAHVEQVSVDPRHARRRIGQRLVDAAGDWARGCGLSRLTLTTFEQVPWNAPYYRTLGFVVVPDAEQPAELHAVRDLERARGLDRWPRVAMVRPLDRVRSG